MCCTSLLLLRSALVLAHNWSYFNLMHIWVCHVLTSVVFDGGLIITLCVTPDALSGRSEISGIGFHSTECVALLRTHIHTRYNDIVDSMHAQKVPLPGRKIKTSAVWSHLSGHRIHFVYFFAVHTHRYGSAASKQLDNVRCKVTADPAVYGKWGIIQLALFLLWIVGRGFLFARIDCVESRQCAEVASFNSTIHSAAMLLVRYVAMLCILDVCGFIVCEVNYIILHTVRLMIDHGLVTAFFPAPNRRT